VHTRAKARNEKLEQNGQIHQGFVNKSNNKVGLDGSFGNMHVHKRSLAQMFAAEALVLDLQ